MSSIRYTAQRAVIVGHTAGQQYDLDFNGPKIDRGTVINKTVKTSLGGRRKTTHKYTDVTWTVDTDYMELEQDIPVWREFVRSVEGGELFTFDAYGSAAVPDNPVTVMLDTKTIREQRHEQSSEIKLSLKFIEQ